MTVLYAQRALLPDGWKDNITVRINADGRIASVAQDDPEPSAHRVATLLPAPTNSHSHAFQRAMAGMSEQRGPNATDSFWTWRDLMFRFLDRLTPDHIEAIAGFVHMEMLEAGYASSVEFHYLHHQPGGRAYDNLGELSQRIVNAASSSGIGLTLLPVSYQYGGLDRRPLGPGQIRFGTSLDQFSKLYDAAARAISALADDCKMGVAAHSLRAVDPKTISDIASLTDGPLHMHLAEQVAEVEEVFAALGQRPVEWVLDHLEPDTRMTFIHCTQMLAHETIGLAESGAVAALCPITESSLGDGIFDGVRWLENGGYLSIGSDSNIRISLSEELRTLEYSQRLRDKTRASLATRELSTGRRVFEEVLKGGALSAGRECGQIRVGAYADLLALDADSVDLEGKQGDTILDSYIFAGDDRLVRDVWSAGRHMVQGGRHIRRDSLTQAYRIAMRDLKNEI